MLRALCAYGVFEENSPGEFSLSPMGVQLRSDVPGSLRNFARFFPDQRAWKCLEEIEHTIRTGETGMRRAFGIDSFEWLAKHPKEAAIFNAAMADVTHLVALAATAAYDFSASRVIMDVGGGTGTFLAAILRNSPAAAGILFDVPAGLREADAILRNAGVANRCKVISGDFFKSVPAGADLMVLKSVIHDWDDECALAILTQCRAAASAETRLVLVERVMPECMTASAAHQRAAALDMRMLTITGGIERTEEEYRQLLGRVGFNLDADDRARAAIGTSHSRSRASAPSARFGCKVARKDFYSASERQLSAIVAPKPPFSFRPFAVDRHCARSSASAVPLSELSRSGANRAQRKAPP